MKLYGNHMTVSTVRRISKCTKPLIWELCKFRQYIYQRKAQEILHMKIRLVNVGGSPFCFRCGKKMSLCHFGSGLSALWVEMIWNRRIHFGGEWVNEWANEWAQRSAADRSGAQRSAWAKQTMWSKRMSERYERISERTSEWPGTLHGDFIVIVQRCIVHCAYRSTVTPRNVDK